MNIDNSSGLPFWIESGTSKNKKIEEEWYYFRKTFASPEEIKYAEIKFNSTGVCGLYINGIFIEAATSRSPGRINRHEVTAAIKKGKNVIGLKAGSSYFHSKALDKFKTKKYWDSSAALQLQIQYVGGRTATIITDGSWSTNGKEKTAWNQTGFDDSDWSRAIIKHRLEKEEYADRWETAALWREIKTNLPEFVFPRNFTKDRSIILDFGKTVVGYLHLEFENASKGTIKIQFDYSETREELKDPVTPMVEKLEISAYLKQGTKEWFNLRRRAFRFMRLTFQGFNTPLKIKRVSVKNSCYPVNYSGRFSCSEKLLEKIWKAGRYTLHVNMHQEYESCPRNEMLYFSGDGRIDVLVDFYAFGDGKLLGSSLGLKDEGGRVCYGLLRPEDGPDMELWDYPAWRIISVKDYFNYTGDKQFVLKHYKDCVRAMEWLIQRIAKNGLIYQILITGGNRIVEWTCSRERFGDKAFLNCLLYKSLKDMADLAKISGDRQNIKRWLEISRQTKKAINKYLWSREKGVYIDSLFNYVPHDGNVLAIIFGIAGDERAKRVLKFLKSSMWSAYGSAMFDRPLPIARGGSKTISPLMNCYEVEARFQKGLQSDAIELIRRCWGTMLEKGAKTFWEFAPNEPGTKWPGTCHAWSSGATYCLSSYVLGVKPAAPGYRKISIVPMMGDLKWVKGVVPTPQGLIGISCNKDFQKKRTNLTVSIPQGCESADIAYPMQNLPYSGIYVNNIPVWQKWKFKPALPGIVSAFSKKGYIYFRVKKSGKYVFTNYLE